VNGLLVAEHSSLRKASDGVVALGLDEALQSERFSEVVRECFGRVVEHHENGFTALNTAFAGNGAFVFIPKGVGVESPLHLLFLSADRGRERSPAFRVCSFGGREQQCDDHESYAGGR
jgi:Fe-S cluster assembly protein SufD